MFVGDARALGPVATRWGGTTTSGPGTQSEGHLDIYISLARATSAAMLPFTIHRPLRPEPNVKASLD